uniref:F-actin-capping protein subunit alpha n=3 Tax=Lygus hesperus TaxID=30085 RepID=A0A0A9W3S8_LYGHE
MPEDSFQRKLAIANYLIKSTPINEVKYSLDDVNKLVQDPKVMKSISDTTLLSYNMTQYVHADVSKSKRLLMTPYNNIANTNIFYDYDLNSCYEVNQVTKEASSVSTPTIPALSPQVAAFRSEVNKALQAYISKYYIDNKCVSGIFVDGDRLVVCLSAINTNLNVYWTGNIRATYILPMNSGTQKLEGKIETVVHYFEEGNVQLHCSYTVDEKNGSSYVTTSPESFIKAVTIVESNWMSNLESMYITMHEDTFKRMRRRLPIRG